MQNFTRYSRQIILPEIGTLGQQKLQQAKVLVIGAGGLGCPVLQNLVLAGVGHIGIVDGDVIEESNLHRQTLYTVADIGKPKVIVAKQSLQAFNPEVEIVTFLENLEPNNAASIFENYQIVVDCTDTIAVRYLINDVTVAKRIPMVYASIHKFQGQVSVFNYKNGPSYRCLFPEKENGIAIPSCEMSGVLGVVPQTLGAYQATEVLKIILEKGTLLTGKLLIYDALHFQTQIIDFAKNTKAIEIGHSNGAQLLNSKTQKRNLTKDVFLSKCSQARIVVIDIRERDETPVFNAQNVVKVPLSELSDFCLKLDKHQEIVLFCQSGKRSQTALQNLLNLGFVNVFHLVNGIQSINRLQQ